MCVLVTFWRIIYDNFFAGYDDENGSYLKALHDHLAYRYEVLEVLGKGSFGQVVKALDHKTGQHVAVKIIRNKKRYEITLIICTVSETRQYYQMFSYFFRWVKCFARETPYRRDRGRDVFTFVQDWTLVLFYV